MSALPPSVVGMDVVELGCGTAYVSAWLARRGANPVGIDNSPQQLDTARRMQEQFAIEFPLHLGNAEALPFPDASFGLAISEYGASIWCDPYRWIPDSVLLLRQVIPRLRCASRGYHIAGDPSLALSSPTRLSCRVKGMYAEGLVVPAHQRSPA